jgi:hypothetical protein
MKKSTPKKGANVAIALPKPIELAKLAAILCSNAQPKTAMERALKFYVEAVCFLRELAEKPHALSAYLSVERQRELFIMPELHAGLAKEREDTLELDPQAESDPAREHLSKRHGLTMWKQGRTVLDNFRLYHERAEDLIESWKCTKNGRIVYEIPRSSLDRLALFLKSRRTERGNRSWETRRKKKRQTKN